MTVTLADGSSVVRLSRETLTYVPVAQAGAGTTTLANAVAGKRHKLVGGVLTMSLTGSLKFADDSSDLTGAMDIALTAGFVLPGSPVIPYCQTAVNSALKITTATGAAKGVVVVLTE